ncbi:MAG: hypothetical protein LQ343_000209 [Gyalolechia ehrenbergii]|nr:MAG: hypothetical protein LQ343_000209 [Gyalolechia ehrenbergii]
MTVVLGKRKRREVVAYLEPCEHPKEDSCDDDRLQNLLRQHFETRFEPLENSSRRNTEEVTLVKEPDADVHDTDWSGFSEEEEEKNAFVVNYENHKKLRANVSREDSKQFMSTKPPWQSGERPSTAKRIKPKPPDPEEVATDAANLKKDLALQRLLEESHLLDPALSLAPSGQKRHKALDMRQQALGSKSSTFSQKNMPLAQRKGILARAAERDEFRRRKAKENGIVLEKATKVKVQDPKRQKEIGAPRVGKFTRGMLTLSKKDVYEIVGRSEKIKRR